MGEGEKFESAVASYLGRASHPPQQRKRGIRDRPNLPHFLVFAAIVVYQGLNLLALFWLHNAEGFFRDVIGERIMPLSYFRITFVVLPGLAIVCAVGCYLARVWSGLAVILFLHFAAITSMVHFKRLQDAGFDFENMIPHSSEIETRNWNEFSLS